MFNSAQEVKVEVNGLHNSICCGCLSSGRTLTTLPQKLMKIYYMLMNDIIPIEKDFILFDVKMCWECKALLRKCAKFQLCVRNAHSCLQQYYDINMISANVSLSNLSIIVNTSIDQIYQHNEEVKKEIVQENLDNYDCVNNSNDESDILKMYSKLEADYSHGDNLVCKDENELKLKRKQCKLMNINRYFKKISLAENEVLVLMEKERKDKVFLEKEYKCEKCVSVFVSTEALRRHNDDNHTEKSSIYSCDLCQTHLSTRKSLKRHLSNHYMVYKCTLCSFMCRHKWRRRDHFIKRHSKSYSCKMCKVKFICRRDSSAHFNELHKKLICDHCGKRFLKKRSMASHIKRNHSPRYCKLCHRSYNTYHSLENHYRMCHPLMLVKYMKTEDSYCVECDKQFGSIYKYKNHLRSSVRHSTPKKVSVPCPDCGKVFSRKTYMTNHYRLTHEKKSQFYCESCDKYYVNSFSLRQHKQTVHDKIPPAKNKICKVCGKCFSTNRSLIYHMRTHTGERPFQCEYCPISFTQKPSMKKHVQSIHMKLKC